MRRSIRESNEHYTRQDTKLKSSKKNRYCEFAIVVLSDYAGRFFWLHYIVYK